MKRMNVLAIATLLMTIVGTLPAIAQSDETAKRFHVFPQLADGGGWLSVLSVTNVSQSSSFCTFELHGLSLDRFSEVSGITASGSTATFSLAGAGGYVAWRTKDESALASGYATLDCTAPTVAQVLYASGNQSVVTGMATVFSSQAGRAFQFTVLTADASLGIAIANDTDTRTSCDVVLESPERQNLGQAIVPVPSMSNVVRFLHQVIQVPVGFTEGSVKVSCDQLVAVVGLQFDGAVFTPLLPAILGGSTVGTVSVSSTNGLAKSETVREVGNAVASRPDQIGENPAKNIVGGEPVMPDEFPFVAKIIYNNQVGCTGSLIAPDKVLTAGHCVSGYNSLSVGFGNTRGSGPRYQVTDMILHPEYSIQVNDIAILQLESAVTAIQPVRVLTLEEELLYAPSGGLGVAVGWGATHPSGDGGLPGTLQKVTDVPIYTQDDCRQVLDDLRREGKNPQPPSIHERVLCAGEEGRATGNGDSGGPLLVQTPTGWAQVGVLSQATRDPSPQTVVYMGQYTRTSYFLDWIFPTYHLHFAHSANGGGIVSSLVLVNAGANPVRPAIYFYDQDGGAIAAESLVDITEDLEVGDDGALRPGTAMNPLGELTISTHGRGVMKVGSVTATADGPIGGFLRFDIPGLGVAGVGDSPPVRDALVPVRRQVGGINTGVAVRNRGAAALLVRCRLMRAGAVLEETLIPLFTNGQDSRFIDEIFPTADTSDFVGSVRCLTPEPGRFSAVAFELDGTNRIFTTLPVVEVP